VKQVLVERLPILAQQVILVRQVLLVKQVLAERLPILAQQVILEKQALLEKQVPQERQVQLVMPLQSQALLVKQELLEIPLR
jgi:hypothetical protein